MRKTCGSDNVERQYQQEYASTSAKKDGLCLLMSIAAYFGMAYVEWGNQTPIIPELGRSFVYFSLFTRTVALLLLLFHQQLFILWREPFLMFVWLSDIMILSKSHYCMIKLLEFSGSSDLLVFFFIIIAKWSVVAVYFYGFRILTQAIPLAIYPCVLMLHFHTPNMFLASMAENPYLKDLTALVNMQLTSAAEFSVVPVLQSMEFSASAWRPVQLTMEHVAVLLWWFCQTICFWVGYHLCWKVEAASRKKFFIKYLSEKRSLSRESDLGAICILDMTDGVMTMAMLLGEFAAMAIGAMAGPQEPGAQMRTF